MGRLAVILTGKHGIAAVCTAVVILSTLGCGNSHAYKEGYETGYRWAARMSDIAWQTENSVDAILDGLDDPERIEAHTGIAEIPYPKGSSDRKEWVQGYKDGMKAGRR